MAMTHKSTLRAQLLQQREKLTPAQRTLAETTIGQHLHNWLQDKNYTCVGGYWPIRGEVDLRPLLQKLAQQYVVALPVSQINQPLNFVRWHPDAMMIQDAYKIPVPAQQNHIHPDCLLIPCVGFDAAGYRLGYGAGFYDRTLAAWNAQGQARPVLVGVSFSGGKIASSFHQPHDVALEWIVTEAGLMKV